MYSKVKYTGKSSWRLHVAGSIARGVGVDIDVLVTFARENRFLAVKWMHFRTVQTAKVRYQLFYHIIVFSYLEKTTSLSVFVSA